MRYRFVVGCWTNQPEEAERALTRALELHPPLMGEDLKLARRELTIRISPSELGKSADGDPWRFYIEGETYSSEQVLYELQKAIDSHPPADAMGLRALGIYLLGVSSEARQTAEDVDRWFRQSQQE